MVSDSLIMPREQVKASSWMPPCAAQIAWDEGTDETDEEVAQDTKT